MIVCFDGGLALPPIPGLSPEFLLKGVTAMARQDWAGAVSNLWVIAEQLTAYLWSRDVIDESKADSNSIVGRRPQLEDSRTWTAANRQELYQKGSFGTETLRALYV